MLFHIKFRASSCCGDNAGSPETNSTPRRINPIYLILPVIMMILSLTVIQPHSGRAATLDRSGAQPPVITINDVSLTRHTFKTNSPIRTYHITISYTAVYKAIAENHPPAKVPCTMVWNGSNNRWSIKASNYGEIVYQCGHIDPILNRRARNPKLIKSVFDTSFDSSFLSNYFENRFLHDFANEMAGYHPTVLVWEAMAKSMHPTVPKQVKKVPANVLLQVKVASDIPVPAKQQIDFYVDRQDGKPLHDAAGKQIKMPIRAKFINGNTAFKSINNLPKGIYRFHARMMTSMTTAMNSKKISFTVGKKAIAHFNRGLRITSPHNKQTCTGNVPVSMTLPQLQPDSVLTLELWWTEDSVPDKNSSLSVKHFPKKILSEKVKLKPGQIKYKKIYEHSKLLSLVENKPGTFSLKANLNKPYKDADCSFRLAMLGTPATDDDKDHEKSALVHFVPPAPQASGFKPVYQVPARIKMTLKNTPSRELIFELHRKSANNHFQLIKHPAHQLAARGHNTNLTLTIKEPGLYQVRFRRKNGRSWSRWQSFKVKGKTSIKKINPQPEPPGRNITPAKKPVSVVPAASHFNSFK